MKRKKGLLALELLVCDEVEADDEVDVVPWPRLGQAGGFMAWWPVRLLQGLLPGGNKMGLAAGFVGGGGEGRVRAAGAST
jgi:hypothetical protein